MLDWIKNGMREDYHGIVYDTATALYGCIDNAIHNFAAKNKRPAIPAFLPVLQAFCPFMTSMTYITAIVV